MYENQHIDIVKVLFSDIYDMSNLLAVAFTMSSILPWRQQIQNVHPSG